MVLTRRQRKQRAEELEAAIEKFMVIRAVALSAPPPVDPIPVVDVADSDEEITREWEKEMEDSVDLLLMCVWCKHTGNAGDGEQTEENHEGGNVGDRATKAQMGKEARAVRKKRREELTKELALLKGDINVELEKVRASYGDAGA